MKNTILPLFMFFHFFLSSQNITSIVPNAAMQGTTVPLIISGNNISFSGWSCWSNTNNLSDFRFSQWSAMNMIYGVSNSATSTQLNGSISVPAFQPTGVYNLEVLDCWSGSWVLFPNSFSIYGPNTSVYIRGIESFKIYPNPTSDIFNIKFNNLIVQDIKLKIINSIGEVVFSENIVGHTGGYNQKIDLKEKSKGIYFVEITTNDGVTKKKLILQ